MKKYIALFLCFGLLAAICGCTKLSGGTSSTNSVIEEEIIIDIDQETVSNQQDTDGNNSQKPSNDKNNQSTPSSKPNTPTNNNQSSELQNSSADTTNDDEEPSLQETTNSNMSEMPQVTVFTSVANDIYIVGGKCTQDTEYINISGNGVDTTKIKPLEANGSGYFIGKVKIKHSTEIDIQGKQAGKDLSSKITMDAIYSQGQKNLMMSSDYMPYFADDSRMHFYSAILSYTLSNKIDSREKETARQNISSLVNTAKGVGAEVVYLVVPSSVAIYPETIPEYKAASGESIYKAFNSIATACGAKVIYPLDVMKAHKNDAKGYKIYHNTDSHWTTYGAYWGVSELMNYISGKYPTAKPRTVGEMGFYTVELFGGDALFSFGDNGGFENYSKADSNGGITIMTGIKELSTLYKFKMPTDTLSQITRGNKSSYLTWDNTNERVFTNPNGQGLPNAIIVRDSFARTAFDMVNDRFANVNWLAEGDYMSVANKINSNTDYVIYIVSERNLLKVMHNNKDASLVSIQ